MMSVTNGLLSEGRAKSRAFQGYCPAANTQLSPFLTQKPAKKFKQLSVLYLLFNSLLQL